MTSWALAAVVATLWNLVYNYLFDIALKYARGGTAKGATGDLIVTIDVVVPTTLSEAERSAIGSFGDYRRWLASNGQIHTD